MKLKTLKDLESKVFGMDLVASEKLRAEAIKWFKYFEKPKQRKLGNRLGLLQWMDFFNLTTEDLK